MKALLGLNTAGKGKYVEYEADSNLKDFENIPLKEDIISYVLREVRPYVADAWIDRDQPWTSRMAASARWDMRSTSTVSSSSTSRRGRWPRSMRSLRRWRNGSWGSCGR